MPPDLAEALASARSRLGRLGSLLLYFSTIGSTNDVAATLAENGNAEGAIVMADAQTQGRGRRGRTWYSPPASGLYVSVVLAPARAMEAPERAVALLTLTAGVALAEAVETITGLGPDVKWPNDLLVGRRKLAGILAEGSAQPAYVVLGYGINVGPMTYPLELGDRATSLESVLGRPVDRVALSVETLAALAARYDDLLSGRFDAILERWRRRAPTRRGAGVAWDGASGPQRGVTADIDGWGALLVRVGDRIERIAAGELRWEI